MIPEGNINYCIEIKGCNIVNHYQEYIGQTYRGVYQELNKKFLIPSSYAVGYPRTMVIHSIQASITLSAMVNSWNLYDLALEAI